MIARLFTDHPASVNETYLEHSAFALRFAGWLALAALAALVHAVFPWMFDKTASRIVTRLHARMTHRKGPEMADPRALNR